MGQRWFIFTSAREVVFFRLMSSANLWYEAISSQYLSVALCISSFRDLRSSSRRSRSFMFSVLAASIILVIRSLAVMSFALFLCEMSLDVWRELTWLVYAASTNLHASTSFSIIMLVLSILLSDFSSILKNIRIVSVNIFEELSSPYANPCSWPSSSIISNI